MSAISISSLLIYTNLQMVLLFGMVFLSIFWWIRRPPNLPPGPMAFPIIGNALLFRGRPPSKIMNELWQQFGGIVTIYIGPVRAIVITDLAIMKEAVIEKADDFSNRFMPPVLGWTIGREGSLVFQNGPVWKERRKFMMQSLRNLGVGKKSLEYIINEEARHIMDSFTNSNGEPFDPSGFITYIVANIICKINFGTRFDYDDKIFRDRIDMFRNFVQRVSLTGIIQVFPFLVRTPLYDFIPKALQSFKQYISGILNEHQKTLNEDDVRDIIDMYLLEIKRQEKSGEEVIFTADVAWRAIFEMFGAGTDTTTNTLLFGILLCSLNTEVQIKLQEEIDRVIGTNRQPSYEDRANMPYCEAVLMEIQRFRPVIALTPPHGVFRDVILANYNIPKGTHVFFNLKGLLHNPKVWKNPMKFDPTHFLSEDGKTAIKPDHFVPFGLGRRACLGEHLAKMEVFLFFINFMQRFKFSLPECDPVPTLEGEEAVTTRPVKYRICVVPR